MRLTALSAFCGLLFFSLCIGEGFVTGNPAAFWAAGFGLSEGCHVGVGGLGVFLHGERRQHGAHFTLI